MCDYIILLAQTSVIDPSLTLFGMISSAIITATVIKTYDMISKRKQKIKID